MVGNACSFHQIGFKKIFGQTVCEQIETILIEVEGCINSRPLTYVEEDCAPLTPSHFLIGRSAPFVPLSYGVNSSRSLPQSSLDLVMKSREMSETLEHFWSVWNEQYIRNLPPLGNRRSNMDLAIGSIVLIRDEGKPRLNWPLRKIVSLHQGKDGVVRAATVKTANGEVIRAIQRLHRLEI
ncbi:hypothetical protein ElyMa_001386900 [Elysia marginata]|uniref:DUF5641 domain-containing protein n=1 Tax=Elysia marginata TaxID=1093978 RepID=A0AAV4ITE7_9GAST|nr:hypothetical protein ElyMa_001386900 [Elysia marginata]